MLSRSSSTTNLRRSSILKPPKTRQPFQDLDFNVSSPDNSPDSTKKRRVSFAEKKHVKEFCDLKEQGTIWDNTYEEADQNVSKSIETTNENIKSKNVLSPTEEASFDPLRSKPCIIMEPNNRENSPKNISFNSSADSEFIDVIRRSRGTFDHPMSQTVYCENVELDITEAIGGIEPTVSVGKIVPFESPCEINRHADRNIEKTMIFDNSDSDMKFTQVIGGGKIGASTPLRSLPDLKIEKVISFPENQTIIFEDSIMDLTSPKSNMVPGLDLTNGTNTEDYETPCDTEKQLNDNLISDCSESGYRASQASNKTIFFNDFGCDITKPITSVIRRLPPVDNSPPIEPSEDQTPSKNGLETGGNDLSPNTCRESNFNVSKSRDKTIFFNDIGCEMTEAVNLLRPCLDRDETIEVSESVRIVPFQSPKINSVEDDSKETKKSSGSRIPLLRQKSGDVKSQLELNTGDKNHTELFNESAMDFTTAITRGNNNISEKHPPAISCDFEIDSESDFVNRDEHSNVDMSFTKIVSSELRGNQKESLGESPEDIGSKPCCYGSIDENSECNIDLTESVRPAALYSLNSERNLEEQNTSLLHSLSPSSVSYLADQHSDKKRKSNENTEEIEASKGSHSLRDNNTEQEFSLVQSLAYDKTFNLTNNCKRLKVTDFDNIANCEQTETICGNSVSTFSSITRKTQEVRSAISINVTTADNRVTDSTDNYLQQDEDATPIDAQSFQKNNERPTNDEFAQIEIEEIDGIAMEEEPSFFEEVLDEDEEVLELSHVYEKQLMSTVEKNNNELENSTGSDNCLKNNDDCCFVMFKEGLEKFAKSDKCIWEIRSVDTKRVLIDFISKSIVVAINLEANKELTAPHTIQEIKIVSLLSDSEDGDITVVHNILLTKLDPEKLKRQHKTTQDILPLLEMISQRVKLLIDFMYELDKLKDFHTINRSGNRISFPLYSYKVQLAIKITIDIVSFEDVGPNDVTVECILGNIREKDVKQLITSVKKDHKFLTSYINDIKEYIALVVEK